MAQIITYPKLSTLANNDLLIVSDVSSVNKTTNSLEVDTLAQHIIVTNNVITGGGTNNKLALFGSTGVEIYDSIVTQSSGPTKITVGGSVDVDVNLSVSGDINTPGTFYGNEIEIYGLARFFATSDFSGDVKILNTSSQFSCQAPSYFTKDVVIAPTFGGPAPNLIVNQGNISLDNFGRVKNMLDPVDPQDAATKAYVDTTAGAVDLDFTGNSGTGNVQQGSSFDILGSGPITTSAAGNVLTINSSATEGTGTTNTLPVWSDGPAGVLGDSVFTQTVDGGGNVVGATISPGATDYFFGPSEFSSPNFNFKSFTLDGGYYRSGDFRFENKLAVGRTNDPSGATLDVGLPSDTDPAAWFRNGVVISNNPGGVQVDNTSMVIGAGNNDNISGSDHCLIVGSGNQILNNSDQSVAFGQGNTISGSTDSLAVGNNNDVSSAQRVYALGFNNSITSASSFVAGGDNSMLSGNTNIMVGYSNSSTGSNTFAIGNDITVNNQTMVLGFRNNLAGYPLPNKNLGLGDTKFVVAVGSGTVTPADNNAVIITEGGVNGGSSGLVPQVPRIVLPTIVNFDFTDDADAAANGIPIGGIYHNSGQLFIRLV